MVRIFSCMAASAVLLALSPSEAEAARRQFISVGTAPAGGAFFVVGGAIADTLNLEKKTHNWQATAEATKGTQENIRRLDQGELDFALGNAAISWHAVRGEGGWDKKYAVSSIMTLAPNVAMFIAPESSGVKRIADLKGKRVVVGPAGAGFEYFIRPILAAHGVSYADFTPLYGTQAAAVGYLKDGSAKAAFLGGAVPTASITQACATQDILFLPFEPEARTKLIKDYPFFQPFTIPAEKYSDLEAPYEGLNVGSMILMCPTGLDEDLVYRAVKTLYEHRADVVKKHPAGKAINPKNVARDTGTPFHPGAVKYYREIGVWPDAE